MKWSVTGPNAIEALYRLRVSLGYNPDPDIVIGGTRNAATFWVPEFLFQAEEWQAGVQDALRALTFLGFIVVRIDD
jgi:hypothetical protein